MPMLSVMEPPTVAPASSPGAHETQVAGYEQLTESVRGMRALLVAQRHSEARAAADGLLELALQLEQHTRQRNVTRDVKAAATSADEVQGHNAATDEASSLLLAQEHARQELRVTLEVLADLRGHTEKLLASLLGHGQRGYDRTGRARR